MRAFIVVVVVCLVVGVTAAWWFQWWNISTVPSDDGNKTEVRLSVDREKVRQDIGAAQGRITGGRHKGANADTDKAVAHAQPIEGTIRKIDPANQSFTVTSQKDGAVTVRTDGDTIIRVGDNEATLADLHVGDLAAMTYRAAGQEGVARTVTVTKQ